MVAVAAGAKDFASAGVEPVFGGSAAMVGAVEAEPGVTSNADCETTVVDRLRDTES